MFPFYDWGASKSHSILGDMAHSDSMDSVIALQTRDIMTFISNGKDRAAKMVFFCSNSGWTCPVK